MSPLGPFNFDPLGLVPIPPTEEEDFARGYKTAAIAALTIEKEIRAKWPNESKAFYRGVLDGIRQEF